MLVVALAGCGQVVDAKQDAAPVTKMDAAPDAPPECPTAGEMKCNGACADTLTDESNCGGCGTTCSSGLQICQSGACQQINSTCNRVRELMPSAGDGFYTNPNDNTTIYCDFANGKTYEGILVNVFTATPPGYVIARATDFQDTGFQKAFIAFYNRDGGIRNFSTFNNNNCCITTVTPSRLHLGGTVAFLGNSTATGSGCGGAVTAGQIYTLGKGNTYMPAPLAADFFVTNPMTEMAACGDGNNPAYYFKRRDNLD
jgi:hypothetical protein